MSASADIKKFLVRLKDNSAGKDNMINKFREDINLLNMENEGIDMIIKTMESKTQQIRYEIKERERDKTSQKSQFSTMLRSETKTRSTEMLRASIRKY